MLFAEHGEGRRDDGSDPPAASRRQDRREQPRRDEQLRPGNDARYAFDVDRVHGEHQPRGHRSNRRQPALEYQHHEHADDAVEDGIDEMEPPRPAAGGAPVHGVCEHGDGTVQPAPRGGRPIWLVERPERRPQRMGGRIVDDDAAVVLDEPVADRGQKQAHRNEEHQHEPHRASQVRARLTSQSAVAVSPRDRAARAWTRR